MLLIFKQPLFFSVAPLLLPQLRQMTDDFHLHSPPPDHFFPAQQLVLQGVCAPEIVVFECPSSCATEHTRRVAEDEFGVKWPDVYVRKCYSTWWDDYDGQSVLWLDDFDGSWMKPTELLTIMDGYIREVPLERRGSTQLPRWDRIIISSHGPICNWWNYSECSRPSICTKTEMDAILSRITTCLSS